MDFVECVLNNEENYRNEIKKILDCFDENLFEIINSFITPIQTLEIKNNTVKNELTISENKICIGKKLNNQPQNASNSNPNIQIISTQPIWPGDSIYITFYNFVIPRFLNVNENLISLSCLNKIWFDQNEFKSRNNNDRLIVPSSSLLVNFEGVFTQTIVGKGTETYKISRDEKKIYLESLSNRSFEQNNLTERKEWTIKDPTEIFIPQIYIDHNNFTRMDDNSKIVILNVHSS